MLPKLKIAIQVFIEAWKGAGISVFQKAKAIFKLLKDIHAAKMLWIIIKSTCCNMEWYKQLPVRSFKKYVYSKPPIFWSPSPLVRPCSFYPPPFPSTYAIFSELAPSPLKKNSAKLMNF